MSFLDFIIDIQIFLKTMNGMLFSFQVWPALALMSGVDRGVRVGGRCVYRPLGRNCVVLGTLKPGLASVKVQWEDGCVGCVLFM